MAGYIIVNPIPTKRITLFALLMATLLSGVPGTVYAAHLAKNSLLQKTPVLQPGIGAPEGRLWAIAQSSKWQIRKTLYVDGSASAASDSNTGTTTAPFKTIQAALQQVKPGTRIVIAPGTYREALTLRRKQSGTPDAPVVIEAARKGTVIISGSDLWTDWQKSTVPGVYMHDWAFRWGVLPDMFPDAAPCKPMGRRREMIFVNGEWYRQVESRTDLLPKTFFISEKEGKVYLCAPSDTPVETGRVEVATRETGINMGQMWSEPAGDAGWPRCFVIRGLTIQQCASRPFDEPAFSAYGEKFLVEDCTVDWNNGTGMVLRGKDMVLRNNQIRHNGSLGISVPPTAFPAMYDALLEGNTTSDNNWRGDQGGFYGYAVAGVKIMTSGNFTLRHHTAERNRCPGIWTDKDNTNVLIDSCRIFDNKQGPGLWFEISEGPFLVRNTISAFNQTGLLISNSSYITVENSTLYGNTNEQIGEWSPEIDRAGLYDVALTLKDNVIAATAGTQALFRRPDYPNIYSTLDSQRNLWFSPDPRGWYIGAQAMDFSGWIAQTRVDTDSLFAKPGLIAPQQYDFRPTTNSPLLSRASWGRRGVVSVFPPSGLVADDTKVFLASRSHFPIHYTIDGSEPGMDSPIYREPIRIEKSTTVRAKILGPNAQYNPVATAVLKGDAPPRPDISLTDLSPVKNVVGWGKEARTNRSIQDKPLSIAGILFAQGIGAHATSELIYDLKLDYRRFVAVVGIDDEAIGQSTKPAVIFSVYADQSLLKKTNPLALGSLEGIDVNIPEGTQQLRLVITSANDSIEWTHADWARAGFCRDRK